MKAILLFSIILFLFACKNDPDPAPADIVTYSDARSFTNTENWIIAWNSNGELLDYKKYATGEVVTLKSSGDIPDNKITIGLLNYNNSNNYQSHDIIIYTDITPGQTFSFNYPPANSRNIDPDKKFTVNVPSSGGYRFLQISDELGYFNGGISSSDDFKCDCTITPASEYNVMYRTDNEVKHKILSNVKSGDVINLAEGDFTSYEHEVTYTYPPGQVNLIINGYTSATPTGTSGVVLDFYLASNISTSITTGYYETSFSRFATLFDHSTGSGRTHFTKIGSLPTTMNIPGPATFSVTNKDPFNISFSAPSNALFHQARWGNQLYEGNGPKTTGYVQWTVTGLSAQVKIGALPNEILTAYPLLKIDASHYLESSIFLGPQTYNEYVGVKLNGNYWDDFEQTSIKH